MHSDTVSRCVIAFVVRFPTRQAPALHANKMHAALRSGEGLLPNFTPSNMACLGPELPIDGGNVCLLNKPPLCTFSLLALRKLQLPFIQIGGYPWQSSKTLPLSTGHRNVKTSFQKENISEGSELCEEVSNAGILCD